MESSFEKKNWKAPFFTVWIGQAFSLLGSNLVQFALVWYLTKLTGSAVVLTTATLVAMLPQIFLAPIAGSIVDRGNRRRIMIAADTCIALVTLGLAVLFALGVVQIWHIYVILFLRSLGGAFHGPAFTASTSLMVPKEHLARIQGFNQMLNGGLSIFAAPLGALLLELLPMQGVIAVDVVTAAIAVGTLVFIRIPQPPPMEEEVAGVKNTLWQDMRAGFRYVLSWPGLLIVLLMATLINFLLTPAGALSPLLIRLRFGGGAQELGWFEAALGAGAIVGGLLLGAWGGFKRKIVTAMAGLIGLGDSHRKYRIRSWEPVPSGARCTRCKWFDAAYCQWFTGGDDAGNS
ncbi:MAG TPA: MFS transporter [Terriglobales bacterium]|nr:MFS transporter [Terriglobales bacterium]